MGLYSEFVFVDEAYFGKTSEVKKIEQAIHVARQPYLGKNLLTDGNFYNDKNIMKVGDAIQKAFNFSVVDFNIKNDSSLNAYCIPISSSLTSLAAVKTKIVIDKNGKLKCRNQNSLMCAYIRIHIGMWGNTEFTDAEITAILLHEIGHCVQYFTNSHVGRFTVTNTIVQNILDLIKTQSKDPNLIANLSIDVVMDLILNSITLSKVNNKIKQNSILSNVFGTVDAIKGIYLYLCYSIFAVFNLLPLNKIKNNVNSLLININNPDPIKIGKKITRSITGKPSEYNADSFAVAFGYSEDLASSLLKMELSNSQSGTAVEEIINNIPIIGTIDNVISIPFMILLSPFISHPLTPKRINAMVVELETELKRSDLSPAMKKEVKENIKAIKETVDLYTAPKNTPDTLKYNRKWLQKQINYKSKENKFADMDMIEKEVYEAAIVTEYIRISALYESLLESEFDNEYEDDDIDILDWEC